MNNSEVYPIGTYVPAPFTEEEKQERLGHLRDLPRLLEGAAQDLWYLLGPYAWRGRHHAMQIIRWRERTGR